MKFLINKDDLYFEDSYDFVVIEKKYKEYDDTEHFLIKVQTRDGRYEHTYHVFSKMEYERIQEGSLIRLGVIKSRKKPDVYIVTDSTTKHKAMEEIERKRKETIMIIIVAGIIFVITLGFFYFMFIGPVFSS